MPKPAQLSLLSKQTTHDIRQTKSVNAPGGVTPYRGDMNTDSIESSTDEQKIEAVMFQNQNYPAYHPKLAGAQTQKSHAQMGNQLMKPPHLKGLFPDISPRTLIVETSNIEPVQTQSIHIQNKFKIQDNSHHLPLLSTATKSHSKPPPSVKKSDLEAAAPASGSYFSPMTHKRNSILNGNGHSQINILSSGDEDTFNMEQNHTNTTFGRDSNTPITNLRDIEIISKHQRLRKIEKSQMKDYSNIQV